MNPEIVSRQIFDIALPYAQQTETPVSYVNVSLGFDAPINENDLWESFNRERWNTPLSSSELFISRSPQTGSPDTSIRVASLTLFEDGEGSDPVIHVSEGLVY